MDQIFVEKKIAKRKRERKWSDLETNLLIKYLKEHEFEKPTAKDYYMRFIQNHEIKDMHWSLVRNKVRNMRSACFKAANWLNSTTGPKMLYEGETVNGIVNRLCPHYFALKNVFSKQKNDIATSSVQPVQNAELETTTCDDTIHMPNIPQSPTPQPPADGSTQLPSQLRTASTSTFTQYAANIGAPLDKATLILLERSAVEKARLSLEEKKVDFEKEKLLRELALREKELERDERLKILELESKERVAMRELEYKYKRK